MPQVNSNAIPQNRSALKDKKDTTKKEKTPERRKPEVETTVETDEFSTKITIIVRH